MEHVQQSVVAGFDARQAAEHAADQLLKWGFSEDEVIVAVRDHDYAASGGLMVRSEDEDPVSHLAHLIGLTGVSEEEARDLATRFDSMDAVVAVDVDGRADEAREILRDYGANFDGGEAEARPDWEEARHVFRGHWEQRSTEPAKSWDEAEVGYHYVYEKGVDPEFRGRTWQSAEPKLQSGFEGWVAERGYQVQSSAWEWIAETLHELWSPTTRGASPDDIVHPERLHRWVRLERTRPITELDEDSTVKG